MSKMIFPPHKRIEGEIRYFSFDYYCDHSFSDVRPAGTLFGFTLPEFQRPFVWTEKQQIRFIESIFLGYDLGRFVINLPQFIERGKGLDNIIIDGQQRLTSINNYVLGKFPVFGNLWFSDLEKRKMSVYPEGWYCWGNGVSSNGDEQKGCYTPWNHWMQTQIPYLRTQITDIKIIKELYNRLNYGGTPHE